MKQLGDDRRGKFTNNQQENAGKRELDDG